MDRSLIKWIGRSQDDCVAEEAVNVLVHSFSKLHDDER